MALPIVIAHHLIWTGYGWWLPNDPRGSTSKHIRNDLLAELGDLHFGRKRAQPAGSVIRRFYHRAADHLRHPLLTFDDRAVQVIGEAFANVAAEHRYTVYACAVMPDHVHLLIRTHRVAAEQMIAHFQRGSASAARSAGCCPDDHRVWCSGGWKVFLDHPDEIRRTIRYVEDNPTKARRPTQPWGFVKAYDGWPLHPGHSPNSPYARRLREG